MNRRFLPSELYELRNTLPVTQLIRDDLAVPSKISEGIFRFLCPLCNEFQTATQSTTNLARCFRCEKNFNTIDLVMAVKEWGFVESVMFLKRLLEKNGQDRHCVASLQSLAAGIGSTIPGGR